MESVGDFLDPSHRAVVASIPRVVAIEVPEAGGPTSEGDEKIASYFFFLSSLFFSHSLSLSPNPLLSLFLSPSVHFFTLAHCWLCPSRQKDETYVKTRSTRVDYSRLS